MTYKPLENLKGHASSKPPMVVFVVCLFLFAVAMVSLGLYIKDNAIQDYDLSEDWNSFLDEFSSQQFCLMLNDTTHTEIPNYENETVTVTMDTAEESVVEEAVLENKNNHTMSVYLTLDSSVYLSKMPPNVTLFASVLPASVFGFKDADEQVHVLFELPEPFKPALCKPNVHCAAVSTHTCLTLIATEAIFPTTKAPAVCNNVSDTRREYTSAWLSAKTQSSNDSWCSQGITAHAHHRFDPRLTVMLSAAERSIINLHLMYTSYFLFVMVITWVCYALLKGPPAKQRIVHVNTTEKKGTAPI
ncbi:transmembrane protein 248-like [Amphiura filiformis]|uniref:transmembrane protein 248-like n=1 Tax=Amphiura filiformis TaxID=82378 RepID=UPI003B22200D